MHPAQPTIGTHTARAHLKEEVAMKHESDNYWATKLTGYEQDWEKEMARDLAIIEAQYKEDLQKALKKFPNACTHCDGSGIAYNWENDEFIGSCPYCIRKEVCSRCGSKLTTLTCKKCKWDFSRNEPQRILPPLPW
jgi:hypothetical protein